VRIWWLAAIRSARSTLAAWTTSPITGAFRRTGSRRRRSGPCLGDELDQEERASARSSSTSQEVRSHGAGNRRCQKRRVVAGLKQTMRNPWEVLQKPIRGHRGRRRSQEHHRIRLFIGLPGHIDGRSPGPTCHGRALARMLRSRN